jgi:hypothetical protein
LAVVAALLLSVGATSASASGGNSANAKLCQKNGWESLVGSDGTTFANEEACVSYGAQGGTYASGLIIPAGETATLTNPQLGPVGDCDFESWGYQLNLGANQFVANLPGPNFPFGCPAPGTAVGGSGTVIGPFATATLLRVWLNDFGSLGVFCDLTIYNDTQGGAVFGSNPSTVVFHDGGGNCSTPKTPTLNANNFNVTLTIQ